MRRIIKRPGFWIASAIIGVGAVSFAQVQTGSPFANKKKTQAWEVPQANAPTASTSGTYVPPVAAQTAPPSSAQFPSEHYSSQAAPLSDTLGSSPSRSGLTQSATSTTSANTGAYYPPQAQTGARSPFVYQLETPGSGLAGASPQPYASSAQYSQSAPGSNPTYSQYGGRAPSSAQPYPSAGPHGQARPAKRSWSDRLGFGNLATSVSGFLKLGAAATENDGWDADFIVDGRLRGEVSAITESGLEYGIGTELRAQFDPHRRGFGGRVGDCPPTLAGCASVDVNGTPTAIRGHSSQFYTSGPSDAKDVEIALEGAYVFLRSAYGDVSLGRDDGSAYLFSLGAPTLVAIGVSNSPVDYTGLDSVKTVNDASGFAEKVTYTSPGLRC